MSGGTMSGNCATGRPSIAMSPPRTVRIAMTIATMGRLMKKRAMASLPSAGGQGRRGRRRRSRCGGIDGSDGRPRLHAGEPFDDYALAGGKPAFDDPHAPDALGRLDGPDLRLVVGADDKAQFRTVKAADRVGSMR